jgi:hypothetical protein
VGKPTAGCTGRNTAADAIDVLMQLPSHIVIPAQPAVRVRRDPSAFASAQYPGDTGWFWTAFLCGRSTGEVYLAGDVG